MTVQIDSEGLHRLVKLAIDNGTAESVETAQAIFQGYALAIEIDAYAGQDPIQQAMLLTIVALAVRVFMGGVTVYGDLSGPHLTDLPLGRTLGQAVEDLGGQAGTGVNDGKVTVVIGNEKVHRDGFAVRPLAAGWRGGIVPAHSERVIVGGKAFPLAGMLAAALAVNEAFLHVNTGAPAAGKRVVGLSLWNPGSERGWLNKDADEPQLTYLPSKLWLIGLGHLGQAFLWALGLLPYTHPSDLSLILQDFDTITGSTRSTSILTGNGMLGQKKTRAMAEWAETRGFQTVVYERAFDGNFRRQDQEPAIALCGLDNAEGRRALDQVGFDLIVEAGLGRGHRDFRTMRLHCLPGKRTSADMWKAALEREKVEDRPAYARLFEDGVLDRCGMTLLAGKAVGAPFVGAVAAALAISEVLRLLHGGAVQQLIDLDLLSVEHIKVVPHYLDFNAVNPGFAFARLD